MNKYLERIWLYLYNFIIMILYKISNFISLFCKFVTQTIQNYVNNVILEINKPNIDFFEKFYYNCIFFTCCSLIQIKPLIINLLKLTKNEFNTKSVQLYEKIFGNKKFALSTPNLFNSVLNTLPINSTILDMGCGSGVCYKNNDTLNLIIKSNFKITGVDINKIALSKFQERINKNSLGSKVKLCCGDIMTMKLEKYDYIIFSESAPTIPKNDLHKIVFYITKNLLNENGKIIFINNLVDKPQKITKFLKPKLKYITSIDFGRTLTKLDFDELGYDNNMSVKYELIEKMSVEDISKLYYLNFIYKIFNKFGFKNYDVLQYKITLEK
jgi:SAM-dependent methyltransferase